MIHPKVHLCFIWILVDAHKYFKKMELRSKIVGSWNGVANSSNTNNQPNPMYRNWYSMNEIETSAIYELNNKSVITKLTLTTEGHMVQSNWINRTQGWFLYSSLTSDNCERHAL
ncbi:putative S-locus glycoprotein [Helianthus annuus]|nr:putative S-locus glycoprotein [Helianthus annuus]